MVKHVAAFLVACVSFLLVGVLAGVGGAPAASRAVQLTPDLERICLDYGSAEEMLCYRVVAETPANATATPMVSTTPTSTATATPEPTLTPTNTPTGTNTPTVTPSATQTPTGAPTVTIEPTPTQEITPPPSSTPGPTQEPPLPECHAVWLGTGLNVRSEPDISGTKLGTITGPTTIYLSEIRVNNPGVDEWGSFAYQGKTGWIALFYGGVSFAVAENTLDCQAIRVNASEIVRSALGWHAVISGIDQTDMAASFWTWKLHGIVPAVKAVETWQSAGLAIDSGGIGVVRIKRGPMNGGDCADVSLTPYAAVDDQLGRHLPWLLTYAPPSGGYSVEIDNECDELYWNVAGVEWTNQYFTAEITQLSQYYPGRVVFASFLHNGWTRERVHALRDTWEAALEHGACLGMHSYTLPADLTGGTYYGMEDALFMAWLWPYVWQHRDVRRWLMELDPRYRAIPFCLTEFGISGGYGVWQPQEFVEFVSRVYAYDNVLFVAGYTSGAGALPEFRLDGKMNETAELWP